MRKLLTKVKPINLDSTYKYPFGERRAKCYLKMSLRTGQIYGLDLRNHLLILNDDGAFGAPHCIEYSKLQQK
jgi:hypothetical protein